MNEKGIRKKRQGNAKNDYMKIKKENFIIND